MKSTSCLLIISLVGLVLVQGLPSNRKLLAEELSITWMEGTPYAPLEIAVGDTVTWTWSMGSPHDVSTATAADSCTDLTPISGDPVEEGTYSQTFDTAGTYFFACSVGDHCDEADHAVSWKLGVTYPTLNIPSGDSVTWSWDGGVPHNVASAPGAGRCDDLQVLSDALSTEGNFSKTFDSAGTYYFACEVDVHCQDGMQITIQVS
ncbi:hypothetical protein F751_6730 [Auxenochlorella protothecoides]|uniref:Blue (type 1) copper domain-containing protein n=1 Tax=Auxenochlorella protothecoides TaxID=3075 RepID=A0A087SAE5_AUXPR|nr:hypothetical protein F751_6730 [Auxenochlorella protothecoides]KFM22699.1 hypothetical protein F751_6730 [Auxenochlorella protothecoides]